MKSPPGIPLYNQDRLNDDDFVANFVARGELVEALLNDLAAQAERCESRHALIVGARGMGKSSLLRRIAIGVTTDARLRETFIPLRFREEQYNVITLDAFWRNCGEALAEWCENDGRGELAARLDDAIAKPQWRDAGQAAAAFVAACADLGRRAILLIDNLDIVLGSLAEQECWALRNVLQRKGGPIILGAATSLLRQGGDSRAPFYEFFFPHILEPLSEAELLRCMRALADKRGEPGESVSAVLDREPQRVRALFALTGGNPRVLALIYQLLEREESQQILADLETLLDSVTPYYKARIEEYGASQQRAIIDAIALNWDPMTSNAIGQVTGVEVTTVSSQLARLKKDGFIEEVATSGARAGYQIGERFLNIWYLMRHGTRRVRQRLRWLTLFLTKLFSPEELGQMLEETDVERTVEPWRANYRLALRDAYDLACAPSAREPPSPDLSRPSGLHDQSAFGATLPATVAAPEPDLIGLEEAIRKIPALFARHEYADAVAVCDDLVARFGDATETPLRELVAWALFHKGIALAELGRSQEAIEVCDELLARFSDATETPLREQVAGALLNKGVRLGALGRSQEEIDVYDDLLARFGDATETPLREQVAWALLIKGFRLGALGRSQEEIDVYDDLLARFGDATETLLREQVARALLYKGVTLAELGRSLEAIEVYDDLFARFGDATEAPLRERLAWTLFAKGVTLAELGRSQEAIEVYDDLFARFGDATETPLRERVARTLDNKGRILFDQRGDAASAEACYRRALIFDPRAILTKGNLAWAMLAGGRVAEVETLRAELVELEVAGLGLLTSALDLAKDNFGSAVESLGQVLGTGLEDGRSRFFEDLLRLLRLAEAKGYGERLIGWFESAGQADRYAPIFAAFVAFVRGENLLLDVNPEVRAPARKLFDRLAAPRRFAAPKIPEPVRRGRGRPRKDRTQQ